MKTETLRIQGMKCNHCVMSVRRQLAAVAHLDVDDVQVGSAVVTYDDELLTRDAISAAVAAAGYTVVGHEE